MTDYSFVMGSYGGQLTPLILNQDDEVVVLTAGTTIKFLFEKPDGTIVERTGTVLNSGTDGKAKYVFVAGDLDQAGVWYYWIKLTTASFVLFTDEKKTFRVRED